MPHQPTTVTRTTSITEPSLVELTNVTKCTKQVHQPKLNHGRMDQVNHGKVIGNMMDGGTYKTCGTHQSTAIGGGYLIQKGSFARDRWTHLTLLFKITTHTSFHQSNLSVTLAIVNPLFSSMSKNAGESFAASANAKQKPVHCTAMIARKLNDKNDDMDYPAVLPPEYRAGGRRQS